jgi:CSLREA domain-containing protein
MRTKALSVLAWFIAPVIGGLLLGSIQWTKPVQASITGGATTTAGTVITVTTTIDELNADGACSLREAIQAANTDTTVDACPAGGDQDTVVLPSGVYTLSIEGAVDAGAAANVAGDLDISSTISLQGSAAAPSVLAGDGYRILHIHPNATVTINRLTIRNGFGGFDDVLMSFCGAGGILNWGTTLILNSTIHGNSAGNRLGVAGEQHGCDGGGVYNSGNMMIVNSTISDNRAGDAGSITHGGHLGMGACGNGGGVVNTGTLTLINSTIVNNVPGFDYLGRRCLQDGTAGGVFNSTGNVHAKNTIIAGNETSDCSGAFISEGNNLIERSPGCSITGATIQWVAHLGALADNGGPTLTHALLPSSPAIDAGSCTDSELEPVTTDQRGEPRPQGEGCDIGAYESPYTSTFMLRSTALPMMHK